MAFTHLFCYIIFSAYDYDAKRCCSFVHPSDPSGWRSKSMFVLYIIILHPDGSSNWIFKNSSQILIQMKVSLDGASGCRCIQMHLVKSKMINHKNDFLKWKYYFQTVNSIFLHIHFSAITKKYIFSQNWKTHISAKTARCVFPQKKT